MIGTKVLCIDDTNRHSSIPVEQWPVKGKIYSVRQFDKINIQGGIYGLKLEEISIDDCFPYTYYAADRFIPVIEIKLREIVEELEEA